MELSRRGSDRAAHALLVRSSARQPTCTLTSTTPQPGFHRVDRIAEVGHGDQVFAAAVEHVMTWQLHRDAGLAMTPATPRAEIGTDVVAGLPFGLVQILAPCRVVIVVEAPRTAGFRYATLPGHPERGLEEFLVEQTADGAVQLCIRAISKPGSLLTAVGSPVSRLIQRRVTEAYVAGLVSAVARP